MYLSRTTQWFKIIIITIAIKIMYEFELCFWPYIGNLIAVGKSKSICNLQSKDPLYVSFCTSSRVELTCLSLNWSTWECDPSHLGVNIRCSMTQHGGVTEGWDDNSLTLSIFIRRYVTTCTIIMSLSHSILVSYLSLFSLVSDSKDTKKLLANLLPRLDT